MKEGHFIKEKIKDAKDLYETYVKLERDYKHLFNGKLRNIFLCIVDVFLTSFIRYGCLKYVSETSCVC